MELRREVKIIAQLMELKLRENDHKLGWKDCDLAHIYRIVDAELHELMAALIMNRPEAILDEFVDVANTTMMLLDQLGLLDAAESRFAESAPAREKLAKDADLVDAAKLMIIQRLQEKKTRLTFRELRVHLGDERLPVLRTALEELSEAKLIRIVCWTPTGEEGDAYELIPYPNDEEE